LHQQAKDLPVSDPAKDLIVLLHGIGHSRFNMMGVEHALKKFGYVVLNISYTSTRKKISALADDVKNVLENKAVWQRDAKVHFVCHSLGGLVAHQYLHKIKNIIPAGKLGRAVMLGTPHGGSEVADYLHKFPLYRWVFGPAGQELITTVRAKDDTPAFYDLGIIAGTSGRKYFLTNRLVTWTHKVHDGRVTTKNAKLQGMTDYIEIAVSHSFMAWKKSVYQQIIHFLKTGVFKR
jgi:pimeloyl-ACP methyl ester carboxylesterase